MPLLEKIEKNYSPREPMPLASYAVISVAFNAILAVMLLQKDARSREARQSMSWSDVLLLGAAAHKLSRIISKDAVTSFLRAPFTRYQEPLGYGELSEKPRGEGVQNVIGELLSCNYCMDAWVGLGLFFFFTRSPREARFLSSFFTTLSVSDFLQVGYELTRTRENVLTLREEKLDRAG